MNQSQVQLLAEIGFMASGYGLISQVEKIVSALEIYRPESEKPYLIKAMLLINSQKYEQAINILSNDALSKSPDNSMVQAFLGMVYHLDGQTEKKHQLLTRVLNKNDDAHAVGMANSLLKEI